MEEKAEVKIKKRKSANTIQTGAAAFSIQNSKILLPAPAQPLWETEHTLRLILIEINLMSAIFHKVLQLIENQRKLF